jgi:hypothetical protein
MPNGSEMHAGFGVLHCSAERVTSSGPAVFNTAFGAPATVCF